jgi:hypothetical protein
MIEVRRAAEAEALAGHGKERCQRRLKWIAAIIVCVGIVRFKYRYVWKRQNLGFERSHVHASL